MEAERSMLQVAWHAVVRDGESYQTLPRTNVWPSCSCVLGVLSCIKSGGSGGPKPNHLTSSVHAASERLVRAAELVKRVSDVPT